MTKTILPSSSSINGSKSFNNKTSSPQKRRRRSRRTQANNDVLISAVISTYLLTHLHHVLQHAEYGALKEGRDSKAANFAQLRKVLCMDARSMKDASALGMPDNDLENERYQSQNESKAA